jgi:hypothetical protein
MTYAVEEYVVADDARGGEWRARWRMTCAVADDVRGGG